MNRIGHALLTTISVMLGANAVYAAQQVEFVACPVYRDARAGKKSGCWLSDNPAEGIRYDVSRSPTKPDWNFQILVEGVVSDSQDDACGGRVLDPVRVSILETPCPAMKLAADGFPGRPFVRSIRAVTPLGMPQPPVEGPFIDRTFSVFYDFNRHFVIYEFGDYLVDKAGRWLLEAKPKHITVTGYADTQARIVSGVELSERPEVAKLRTITIVESLTRLGIDPNIIEVRHSTTPEASGAEGADGLSRASLRRVDISATF